MHVGFSNFFAQGAHALYSLATSCRELSTSIATLGPLQKGGLFCLFAIPAAFAYLAYTTNSSKTTKEDLAPRATAGPSLLTQASTILSSVLHPSNTHKARIIQAAYESLFPNDCLREGDNALRKWKHQIGRTLDVLRTQGHSDLVALYDPENPRDNAFTRLLLAQI